MKAIPASEAKFVVEAPCSVAAAQDAVGGAAQALELDIEEAAQKPGDPWVLRRGPRLVDPALWYRVDISPAAGAQGAALIRVFAVPAPSNFTDTQETIAKPGSLAMRIVAACSAGGAR